MEQATRAAFGQALEKLGEDFPEIVTVDADLAGSTGTKAFAGKFPERAFNVGISEQDLIGTAAGLAVSGKRPFACSFAVFATGRGWEQIRNTVCTSNLPVTIVGTHAGILTGEDGETHQALEDLAILRPLENLKIFSPADGVETKACVKHILENESGPVYLRLGRQKTPILFSENEQFDFSKLKVLREFQMKNARKKAVAFATGSLVANALVAADKLKGEQIDLQVVNVCCVKPLAKNEIFKCVQGCDFCVTCEDHSVFGGLGGAICEILAERGTGKRVLRIGMQGFGESGTTQDLFEKFGFDGQGIFEKIVKFSKA